MHLEALAPADFGEFLAYLDDHLADNGADGTPYFQPLPRGPRHFPREAAEAFREGLQVGVGQPGWRRAWVVRERGGPMLGHVDLRALPERHATHRCLLGMGVHRDVRRQGLGIRLLRHAEQWSRDTDVLDWIDLQVLSGNAPALRLYDRAGYRVVGELQDMFRLDGVSFPYTYMTLDLHRDAAE